jgi:hypothetical protein
LTVYASFGDLIDGEKLTQRDHRQWPGSLLSAIADELDLEYVQDVNP